MNAHDVIYTHPGDARRPLTLECRCGRMFSGSQGMTAKDQHQAHFDAKEAAVIATRGLPDARRALGGGDNTA